MSPSRSNTQHRTPPRLLAVLVLPWLIPGLIATVQVRVGSLQSVLGPVSWTTAAIWQISAWMPWGLWSLAVRRFALSFPLERHGFVRWLGGHVVACVVVSVVDMAFVGFLDRVFGRGAVGKSFEQVFRAELLNHVDLAVILYWTVLGTVYMVEFHRKYRERELEAAKLRSQLVESELHALRMQLNPHFLFNALNSAAELLHDKPVAAADMLRQMSNLLRQALKTDDQRGIPLWRELELADAYLAIAAIRFEHTPRVDIDIPTETLEAMVPPLVLQPLLENVFQHGGVAPELSIATRFVDNQLQLAIENVHEVGKNGSERSGHGIGLRNTRARLHALFGDDASVTIHDTAARFRVELRMPRIVSHADDRIRGKPALVDAV